MRTFRLLYFFGFWGLLVSSLWLAGCSPSGNDPQAADAQFVGDYKGRAVIRTQTGNQTNTQTVDDLSVQIKAGAKAGEVTVQLFEDTFGSISDPLAATTRGNTLTIAKQKTAGYPENEYDGGGTLSGKTLQMTLNVRYDNSLEVATITVTRP